MLSNIEFFNNPDGEISFKVLCEPMRTLTESDRDIIADMLSIIRDRYSEAYRCLSELYSRYDRNRINFEYKMVHRFIRCNFGEYDALRVDIDGNGFFQFEEVRCPLRGECVHECRICKPRMDTALTPRELDVLRLIAEGMSAYQIADSLCISKATVDRHRENMKARLHAGNVADLVRYYCENIKK